MALEKLPHCLLRELEQECAPAIRCPTCAKLWERLPSACFCKCSCGTEWKPETVQRFYYFGLLAGYTAACRADGLGPHATSDALRDKLP